MASLLKRQLPSNDELSRFGVLPATFGQGNVAAFSNPIDRTTELVANERTISEAGGFLDLEPALRGETVETGNDLDRLFDEGKINAIQRRRLGNTLDGLSPLESPDSLNEQYGHLGLKFDKPTRARVAELLAEGKREELIRDDVISRAPQDILSQSVRFAVAFAGAVIDPINIASAFIPVVGEARFAGFVARYGINTARVAKGVAEGVAGAALVEPITLGLARSQQLDYEMSDALVNVAFGGLLGGGAHAIGGRVGDFLSRQTPEVREAAFRAAVAQAVDGRSVDVGPILRADVALRRELTGSTAVGRFLPDTALEAPSAVRADAPAPIRAESTPEAVFIPSTTQKGAVRVYPDRQAAEKAAAKLRGPTEIKETPSGEFVVGRNAEGLTAYREGGEVRGFKTERQARKFIQNTKREGAEVVPFGRPGQRRYAVVTGATERDLQSLRAAPDAVEFIAAREAEAPTPARQDFIPLDARPFGEKLTDIGRREAQITRDALADPEASFRAKQVADVEPETEVELEYTRATVENMRKNGLLSAADEAELAELDALAKRAEAIGRGVEAAAFCLARR